MPNSIGRPTYVGQPAGVDSQLTRIRDELDRVSREYSTTVSNDFIDPRRAGMTLPGGISITDYTSPNPVRWANIESIARQEPSIIGRNMSDVVSELAEKLTALTATIEELKSDNAYMKAILDEEFAIKTRGTSDTN